MPRPRKPNAPSKDAESCRHPEAILPPRPDIAAQPNLKKTRPATTYRFDSSLAPELQWDGLNPARETAEALIAELADHSLRIAETAKQPASPQRDRELATRNSQLADLQSRLCKISGPFLNWSGKAERLSFDVPTLPLFVHERLSTKAILETLEGRRRGQPDDFLDALYGFQECPLAGQLLRAYAYRDDWVNRLILGDSLVVMNSLLRYESLGGQVQMIYMDPPYGVRFGSNFQPFVRKRDVSRNDDADMTREPEMVQAYRDTWELGLHSYLTCLRDRLLLARELLAPSGSIFVQISDENLHHVREVMDEVLGAENFCCQIAFQKTGGFAPTLLSSVYDYLLWFAKDKERVKYCKLFRSRDAEMIQSGYSWTQLESGERRRLTSRELSGQDPIPSGRRFQTGILVSAGASAAGSAPFTFNGHTYRPAQGTHWKTSPDGLRQLAQSKRLIAVGKTLAYVRFEDDFPVTEFSNVWNDTTRSTFAAEKLYVVQTSEKVIQRCLLMTTGPGDLVLDPTCGSGTTAFVAEQWGRRWITCDTSRVPLALARQRLLTATFDYYKLKDELRGPAGGFVYERRQNHKGEEVGGIVPHITLKSIANNEPPAEEVLVDRPEVLRNVVRVAGPFSFEATIPTAGGLDAEPETPGIQGQQYESCVQRMLEVLRRAPVLRLPNNQTVTLKRIRPPAKTLALSAEAVIEISSFTPRVSAPQQRQTPALDPRPSTLDPRPSTLETSPVAILFGPENGPLSERLVREAWDEAGSKHYSRLYVIGFAIDPKARQFIDSAGKLGIPCTYLQATMDLQMGDLLKNMRSSQIFSVCGLPDVKLERQKAEGRGQKAEELWQVALLGLDSFDPVTMETDHLKAADVPAWFLDTDYNGMVFRVRQAFFPRTGAWENLKKALRVEFEDTVWAHLAGTTSAPFPAGEHRQIAVKVIDPRGNELLVVKKLEAAK
jgi:adenine-specific DNA-methyltransferase